MNTYVANIRAADLRAPDHLPVCPRCFDYSDQGATICQTCCAPLIARAVLAAAGELSQDRETV